MHLSIFSGNGTIVDILRPSSSRGESMRVTLIHNPDAGDDEQPSSDELLALIRSAGHIAVYQSAKADNWDEALKEPGDIVAVAGGDGIVGKVAKQLTGRRIPIAILPMGTANNIAKTLGLIDTPIAQLISRWTEPRSRKFDVGVASGPWGSTYFIEGLGVGLFTQTMYRLDSRDNVDLAHADDTEEKLTSVLEILRERLQSSPVKTLKLMLDGRDLSGDYLLMEVMNVKCIGPNLYLAPEADPGDGFLDVVLLSKGEEDRLRRYLSACIEGKPCSPDLSVHRGQHLQMEWEGSVIHIDDEVWPDKALTSPPPTTIVDVKLNSGSLEFLTSS
jgi:diacylglycerol kinase (ATP)